MHDQSIHRLSPASRPAARTRSQTRPSPTLTEPNHTHAPAMPPTHTTVRALHETTRAAAATFTSYNFRSYFLRRTDEIFAPALAALGDTPPAAALEAAKRAGRSAKDMTPESLEAFVKERERELEVMKRAAVVNAMYGGEKLVVEMPEDSHK